MPLNTIFRRIWRKKDEIQITKFLTDSEMKKYISDVNQMRKDYIRNEEYAKQMYDLSVQNLNFKRGGIKLKFTTGTDVFLEYMALYQKILDIHPVAFEERSTKKIKESLQRSIYSSAQSELSKNFIHKLIPDDRDSFLIFPTGFFYRDNDQKHLGHSSIFIVRKRDSKIIVETIDKSAMRAFYPDSEATSKKLIDKVWWSSESQVCTFNYTYEIKDTKENIFALAEALRIGRLHFHDWETKKNIGLYTPFNRISKISEKEYYTNHIATGQHTQENCMITNLNSALQYLLGSQRQTKYTLDNGTKAIKMKYDGVTKEQIKQSMHAVMIEHLEKLGHQKSIKKDMIQDFLRYKELKIERSKLVGIEKATKKQQIGQNLNKHYVNLINEFRFEKPVSVKSINWDYGKKTSKSLTSKFKKKTNLNNLTKKELKRIIAASQELNRTRTDKNENKRFKRIKEPHPLR